MKRLITVAVSLLAVLLFAFTAQAQDARIENPNLPADDLDTLIAHIHSLKKK